MYTEIKLPREVEKERRERKREREKKGTSVWSWVNSTNFYKKYAREKVKAN